MRKLTALTLTFIFTLFLVHSGYSQFSETSSAIKANTITVSSIGEAIVPVDYAILNVNISVSNSDAERAFELHKEREAFLANLLSDLDLADEKIEYQPISIRPNRQRDGSSHTMTTQQVVMELEDFEQLSEIQLTLIANEFDNFSGNLASTKMEEGARRALRQAVANAREDAELLAEAADKELGEVLWIDHSADRGYRPPMAYESVSLRGADMAGPSLGDFSQSITVQKRIEIRFILLDD